jgi:hypothetical protein
MLVNLTSAFANARISPRESLAGLMQGNPMRPDIVVEPKVDLRFSVFAGLIHAEHALALTKLRVFGTHPHGLRICCSFARPAHFESDCNEMIFERASPSC